MEDTLAADLSQEAKADVEQIILENKRLGRTVMDVFEPHSWLRVAIVGEERPYEFDNTPVRKLTLYGPRAVIQMPGMVERKTYEWIRQNLLSGWQITDVMRPAPLGMGSDVWRCSVLIMDKVE